MDYLKSKGILAVFHYPPLHLSEVGRSMGYTDGQLPVTESMSSRLLRLPFYHDMTYEEQAEVVNAIMTFFKEIIRVKLHPQSGGPHEGPWKGP